jgi:hypothetical protein
MMNSTLLFVLIFFDYFAEDGMVLNAAHDHVE